MVVVRVEKGERVARNAPIVASLATPPATALSTGPSASRHDAASAPGRTRPRTRELIRLSSVVALAQPMAPHAIVNELPRRAPRSTPSTQSPGQRLFPHPINSEVHSRLLDVA